MKTAFGFLLTALGAGVQAHVADLPAGDHALEHAWLALALVPLFLLLPALLRRR